MVTKILSRPSRAFGEHRAEIKPILRANEMYEPRIFGSVFRGDDRDDSDVDLLVVAGDHLTLFGIARAEIALEELLGVPVQITLLESVPDDRQPEFLRKSAPV